MPSSNCPLLYLILQHTYISYTIIFSTPSPLYLSRSPKILSSLVVLTFLILHNITYISQNFLPICVTNFPPSSSIPIHEITEDIISSQTTKMFSPQIHHLLMTTTLKFSLVNLLHSHFLCLVPPSVFCSMSLFSLHWSLISFPNLYTFFFCFFHNHLMFCLCWCFCLYCYFLLSPNILRCRISLKHQT